MALNNIGGSIEALEMALDKYANKPAKGPKEEVVKEIVDRLLSYSSFTDFARMMCAVAQEQLENSNNDNNYEEYSNKDRSRTKEQNREFLDNLISFGFAEKSIKNVMKRDKNASLDELLNMLSNLDEDNEQASNSNEYKVDSPIISPRGGNKKNINQSRYPYLDKFASEVNNGKEDSIELYTKFVMAKSVHEIYDDGDTSVGVVNLLSWSVEMLQLYQEIEMSYSNDIPFEELKQSHSEGLIYWYLELEHRRRDIEQDNVAGNLLSDTELRRMAELDRIAATGTADEQMLHNLISRNEEVSKEVNDLHTRVNAMVSSDRDIKRECIEELYLYLKEKVGSGGNLENISDEMHQQVYSLLPSSKNASKLITFLLEMHVYEDEQNLIRSQISSLVSPSKQPLYEDKSADFKIQQDIKTDIGDKGYSNDDGYNNAYSNKNYIEHDPNSYGNQNTYGQSDNSQFDYSNAEDKYDDSNNYNEFNNSKDVDVNIIDQPLKDEIGLKINKLANIINNLDENQAHFLGDNESKSNDNEVKYSPRGNVLISDNQDTNINNDNNNNNKDNNNIKGSVGHGNDDNDEAMNETLLEDLKSKHKASLLNLKNSLDSEKKRKLQDLEDRLLRRQALLKKKKSSMSQDEIDDNNTIIDELNDEIKSVNSNFAELKDGLLSGFKKRCMYETRATKVKRHSLNGAEKDVCYKDAADSIKERFERDYKSMISSLEGERNKQKAKLIKELLRRKTNCSSEELEELNKKFKSDIAELDRNFDEDNSSELSKFQNNALLSLSSIYIDENMLHEAKKNDDDEDDYLDDDNDDENLKKSRLWLQTTENMKNSYIEASKNFQTNILKDNHIDGDDIDLENFNEDDESQNDIIDMSSHISKVITDAFTNQVQDDVNNKFSHSSTKIKDKNDYDKVRSNILGEFEKARSDYDTILSNSKSLSKNKLAQRIKSRGENGVNKDDGDVEDLLKSVLNNPSLADLTNKFDTLKSPSPAKFSSPTTSKLGPVQPISASQLQPLSKINNRQILGHNDNNREEEKERDAIKSRHTDKEKKLLCDLEGQMMSKKQLLEKRLQKKRDERYEREKNQNISNLIHDEVVEEEEEDIEHLKEELDQINEAYSKALIDIQSESKSDILSPSTYNSPVKSLPSYDNSQRTMSHVKREKETRELMQDEAKKISSNYNEEKQKHDLLMSIQQTRQRQSLQRKLMERKQQNLVANSDGFDDPLLQKTPNNYKMQYNQPVMKGLGDFGNLAKKDLFSPNNSMNGSKKLAHLNSRGMNLTPMLRK
jgi:hypothetical protein